MHPNPEAWSFDYVIQAELDDIAARQGRAIPTANDAERRADAARLFAICLSGGGIRSATFCLGVLQGLTQKSLLQKTDYLSTVSGGGYIGSWLQGLLSREGSFDALDPDPNKPEHPSLHFLRKYSNYLAPRPGFSIDSAVIPVIWMRNTGLNQAIIVAAAFAVLLLLRLLGFVNWKHCPGSGWPAYLIALLTTAFAVVVSAKNLKTVVIAERNGPREPGNSPQSVVFGVVIPLVAAAVALAIGIFKESPAWWWLAILGALAVLHGCLQGFGGFRVWRQIVWMAPLSAAVEGGLIYGIDQLMVYYHWTAPQMLAWTPPLILLSLFVGVGLQIGLMGKDYPDAAREWLARCGAFLAACALAWAAVFSTAIFAPEWLNRLWARKASMAVSTTGAWIASTAAGVLAGKSPATGLPTQKGGSVSLDRIARYAPLATLPGFFIAIACGVAAALRGHPDAAGWMLAVAVAVFCILSLRVNINEFSMHHYYKNRLVRCYLGASAEGTKAARTPNRFTGFDPRDDLPLVSLAAGNNCPGPFPILNATLTVTQGSELATQERKAKSWIFTPLYSGFTPEGSAEDHRAVAQLSPCGYARTSELLRGHFRLGTAMAISGAALNPGQGFHSSTHVAFLMTLFNVRLGWWVGNPRGDRWKRPGPRVALGPLIRELFGQLDERSPYLNLSDGGNFENLGLYELVRRRCRFIIAVDAEQDGDYEFDALGGAVRKCRTDFQVEIDIDPHPIKPTGEFSGAHCALGKIKYPQLDEPGYLLYIKASLTGDEPADVQLYHRQFPNFPQQSTAEQFFTESQFESYRRLGLHCVQSAPEVQTFKDLLRGE